MHYTVTVQNTGDASATGLTFQEIINDPNLTLVANSVNVSPLAINDTFSAVANTQLVVGTATPLSGPHSTVAGNVLFNDTEFLGDTYKISAFDAASTGGGTVSIVTTGANAGSFTYVPLANDTGTDTFTYTITDAGIDGNFATLGDNLTSVGTVTITIGTQKVWYVDNAFAGTSTGTSTNPFKTLADVSGASGPDGSGDIIFVSTGGSIYRGGITLLNNETLWGQNEALVVDGFTLQAAGTDPIIENAAGNGVTLAAGNTLKGFTVGTTSAFHIANTATATVGSLTVSNVILNGTGGLFVADSGGALNVTLDSATTTSFTGHGIDLGGALTGTFTVTTGAISGVSGTDVLVNGGTETVNIGASVTSSVGGSVAINSHGTNNVTISGVLNITGGTGISVNSNTGGTIAFTNASKVVNTGATTAVNLTGNTGATVNFTGGGLGIDTTGATGFNATGGGTVNVTGTGNSITSTTGIALNVANTTIGASNLNFRSITAGTGAGSAGVGISLDTTGSSGGLVVTGTGTTNGSGGTIQHKTGADGSTTAGIGIYLNSTSNVSLKNMQLNDFDNFAIRGLAVNNLTMDNVDVSGTNGTSFAIDEGSVIFGYLATPDTTAGLTGSATISNSTFASGSIEDTFRIRNGSGTLNRVTFDNDTFANLNTIGKGLNLETTNAAVMNTTVQNSFFTSAASDLLFLINNGTGADDLIFTGNTLTNNNPAIATGGGGFNVQTAGTGALTYNVSSNTFRDSKGHAVLMVHAGGGSANMIGTFSGNTIGTATADSGSLEGDGLKLQFVGGGGIFKTTVTNNTVQQYNNIGINLTVGGGAVATGGTYEAIVTGNTVGPLGTNTSAAQGQGIALNGGTVPLSTFDIYVTMGGVNAADKNTVSNWIASSAKDDIRLRQRQSTTIHLTAKDAGGVTTTNYGGAATDTAAVVAFIQANNTTTGHNSATVNSPPGGGFIGGAPPLLLHRRRTMSSRRRRTR